LPYQNKDDIIKFKDDECLYGIRKLSPTKMIGETLERHCETDQTWATAFQNAYLKKKDNNSSSEVWILYIYLNEIISIMFEMKINRPNSKQKKKEWRLL
jgi:hypothetical protein